MMCARKPALHRAAAAAPVAIGAVAVITRFINHNSVSTLLRVAHRRIHGRCFALKIVLHRATAAAPVATNSVAVITRFAKYNNSISTTITH